MQKERKRGFFPLSFLSSHCMCAAAAAAVSFPARLATALHNCKCHVAAAEAEKLQLLSVRRSVRVSVCPMPEHGIV